MMQNLKEVPPTSTLFLFCLTLDLRSKLINEQGHDIVVGWGSVAINDYEVEQWSSLPPNTRNLGRDSRISPKGHGSLKGPWLPIFRRHEVGSTCPFQFT